MSTVNHKFKHIFIHIPKAAGTSIENQYYVGGGGHKHLGALINAKNADYFIWTFVRNPYDRLVSTYHFWHRYALKHNNPRGHWFFKTIGKSITSVSFEEFVHHIGNYITNDINKLHTRRIYNIGIQPRHLFIHNNLIDPADVYIGKVESIDTDMRHVVERIKSRSGKDIAFHQIPNHNVTHHDRFQKYYTNKTRDIVYELYKKDFNMFNYSKLITGHDKS